MKKIFIKYNPYKVTTDITIDEKPLKKNSRLNVGEQRLQEWVDDLPRILFEECNTREFEITFQGTLLDYEDVAAVSQAAAEEGILIQVKHIPAKEVSDKEQVIESIFAEIQEGPFDELKQPDVVKAFQLAKSSDFEVNVVATMSAGKSTLINALLGQKLMPAKHEACTATITEIHDDDSNQFKAVVYDKDGAMIENQSDLTYEIMDRLNSNKNVSRIIAHGNIPFVTAEDISLVLVDTPGPNNARDPEHKTATYKMLSESSKTLVLYILNAQQLSVDDDDRLLNYVSESMRVGGKQSRDRFIFVINQMDEFWKAEDSVDSAINKVKSYLSDKGIENPNVYPASAMTALYIRTVLDGVENMSSDDMGDEELEEAKKLVRRSVNIEKLHFEKYAPLSTTTRGMIENQLALAKNISDMKGQALIHSGIVPIEEAIRMYVLKYAKTAKIKNIVDTFIGKLESAKTFEVAMEEIAKNKAEKESIVKKIEGINAKLESGEEARQFKKDINKLNYDKEIQERSTNIVKKAEAQITEYMEKESKEEMTRAEAEDMYKKLVELVSDVDAEMTVDLENLVNNTVKKNADDLIQRYKEKMAELVREVKDIGTVDIDPFQLMRGDIINMGNVERFIDNSKDTKRVWEVTGSHKEYKELFGFRRWLNRTIGTHFKVDYKVIDDYDWVEKEYIDGQKLSGQFILPVQKQLYKNQSSAREYAKTCTDIIRSHFEERFKELDDVLKRKLDELKQCALDERVAEKKLEDAQKKKAWLDTIQQKVTAILEI